ncbi:hypothetical protein HY488_03675 [Candidatus Woesearchaeota archaeon]|nr:hypothetical protein [Candidatus Woesearchaeota archaeon]
MTLIGYNRRTLHDTVEEEPQHQRHGSMLINVILILSIFFVLLLTI